nr:hypothetical protein BaRGS_023705 [Batillaria attramentaria]
MRRRRTKVTNEKKIADDEFMAAAIGDVEWLKQSLRENGSQINYDKNGLTALHLAAIHGRLECLKLCVEKFKQDINLPSSTGWRPVHLVISNQTGKRSLQCLNYLLEKSADASITNDDGITPVHQAASEGHVQCLKLLIEVGAKIDAKDCRGNTPLDLAKLWGHRKCARILAAEMWHQDKNNVAKEMNQLKKVKMQQVLRELEDEEESKAAQQFYGQQAYEQWLSSRGLEPKATGPPSLAPQKQEPVKEKKPAKKAREPLMKPNSVAQHGQQDVTAEKGALTMSVSVAKKSPASSRSGRKDTVATVVSGVDVDVDLYGDGEVDQPTEEDKQKLASLAPGFVNPEKWNFSPKIPEKEYVPILDDEYPRDEYTIMPVTATGHKFYDGKHVKSEDEDEDKKTELLKKKLRRPRLSKEVINQVMSADPTLHERPIMFKPKHIYDVHKKHKYTSEEKPVSEVPLHLCNDINSELVKMSIRFPKDPAKPYHIHRTRSTSTKSSGSDSKSSASAVREWSPEVYPLPALLSTLKQMSKPDHFPNIHGKEYGLNFGDLTI